jgi:hypothetical protein
MLRTLELCADTAIGGELAFAVACALGETVSFDGQTVLDENGLLVAYGSSEAQTLPVIEDHKITFHAENAQWIATLHQHGVACTSTSEVLLQAAMRALVKAELGETFSLTYEVDDEVTVTVKDCPGLVVNAPHFFKDPQFLEWLNEAAPKFTWHTGGKPGEYSDTIVLVDPSLNGEGSDSDMPEHIWEEILTICRERFAPGRDTPHIQVRLTNLED